MTNETNENIILENMVETEVELANPPTDDSSISVLADPDPEDTIEAYLSTYEIGRGWDMEDKLEYSLRDIESAVATLQADKADATHTHNGYASSDDLQALVDAIDTKANATHSHTEYSSVNHTHNGYATQTAFDTLESEVGEKANVNHTHTEYATVLHSHEGYADVDHTHNDYATVVSFNELSDVVSGKADVSHSHNDTYYTEAEIDNKLADKADSNHTHTGVYDINGAAEDALAFAKAYTDSKIDALVGEGASTTLDTIGEISSAITDNQDAIDLLNNAIANKANVDDLDSHINDATVHVTSAERNSWNAKSNFSGNYNDLTNKPNIPSIDGLATETYVDTQINAIEIPEALSDLTTDSTHRVVTDVEKASWNAKSNFSGNYNDLTNKPSIPSISGLATEAYVDEVVSAKANSTHSHNDIYYTETEIDTLLSNKSNSTHNHNSAYDTKGTAETKANEVQANLDVVSEDLAEHIDNADIHFTATERTKLSGIAANANNYSHPNSGVTAGTYKSVTVNAQGHVTGGTNPTTLAGYGITDAETKGAANSALNSAKAYADELIEDEVVNRDSAIATAKSSAISTAASDATTKANNALASAKTYADNAAATVKNDLLNNAGAAYDTLKELGDLIDDNTDAISALETVASGKANSVHTHAISDITNLQVTLDGKAATNHGTHVSYSTTAPVMDGTASVGTASTVARSDHKHPTDTSRASQTSLDSHTSNKSNPHNVTLSQLGLTATAAELNKLDGVTATTAELNILDGVTITTTELNYVDGVTSNIQTQLNSKASSSHTHSNASTSAAGLMSASDKTKLDGIASGANAYTLPTASSTLGGVKTTSTVTNASGYTACPIISGVPYYKDTNTTYSLSSFGVTATAAELNYVDGVTSNIQTQLNGKAASGHNHSGVYANASHTHTASAVGAVATGDIATVSEVETYLGI